MNYNELINYTGILGAVLFIITTIIGGYLFDDYSHFSQYISESYASGTEYGHLLRWYGYIPSGLLMGGFCFVVAIQLERNKYVFYGLIGFGILYGIFTSLVSVFPCDFSCNRDYSNSSISQILHSVLSVFTYTLTPVSLFFFSIGSKKIGGFQLFAKISLFLCIFGFIFGMLFLVNANSPISGLLQRNTEAIYLIWLILLSIFVIKNNILKLKPVANKGYK